MKGRGLRLQIVLALAGLLLLVFVPLFGAIASITQSTLERSRETSARSLGRAIATHVADARASHSAADLGTILSSHVGTSGALALAVYDRNGVVEASAGERDEVASIPPPTRPYGEGTFSRGGARGRVLDVVVPHDDFAVVARLRLGDEAGYTAQLVRLFALYTVVFAMAFLVFSYFFLTRLIVRPVEELAHAADRVASGASTLDVPKRGARELLDLGESFRDMTTQLLAKEEALRRKVEELEKTTTRLVETRSQLAGSERLASVGRLAAGVAHEIGNPITAIIGMQDLLLEGGLPAETERDFLGRMRKETERVSTIVRDLLDFARTKEAPPSTREQGNVREAIEAAVALVKPQKDMRDFDLEVDVDGSPGPVLLSTQRLTQVVLNLVLNAKDALTSMKAPREKRGIRVRARNEGAHMLLEVEDDGPGIPGSSQLKVFEPFFTSKDIGEGTGLGLAVCRGLVESGGGTIEVDATYTEGARIRVTLPARRQN
jgi:two-component system, NtrC family, sensor kinase